jgi:phosphatidate cytidylyltransferase
MATSSRRRAQRTRRRNSASDLGARIWVAIPAIAFAIFIVAAGGAVFAAGALLLGLICLHELLRMYDALNPVRLAGFVGLAGLAAAAYFGGEHQVLLATVAFFPVMFLLGLAMPARPEVPLTDGMAITLLGTFWIGLAIAHAIMLRELPHGDGIVIDVLVGTFIGDTAAYLGGRSFGTRPLAPRISPNKTVEGLACGIAGATDRLDAAFFTLVAGYYVWLALL